MCLQPTGEVHEIVRWYAVLMSGTSLDADLSLKVVLDSSNDIEKIAHNL